MSTIAVPRGKLPEVVTYLEMTARPPARPDATTMHCELRREQHADLGWYREFFRRIGGPYLWASRLALNDAELRTILDDPHVEFSVLLAGGDEAGILELDFRTPRECELRFFGVRTDLIGHGIGRWLMNRAIERAWSEPIGRFWVHTCTLDHPSAVPFYMRSGFVPYKREVEINEDPRVLGLLPKTMAPGIPSL